MRAASRCVVMVVAGLTGWPGWAHPPDLPSDVGAAFAIDDATAKTIGWLEARVAAHPDDTIGLSSLAGALLRVARQTTRHEDFEKAALMFERLRQVRPESPNAVLGIAHARLGQHRFAEALASAQSAVFNNPAEKRTLALLGDVHLAMGNTTEAALIFEELERNDLSLDSLARIALLRDAQGRRTEAITAMTEAVRAGVLLKVESPQIAWCESMLGEFALAAGKLDEADAHFAASLQAAPGLHHATFQRAQIMARRGKIAEAETALIALAAQFPLPRYWIALGEVHLRHGEEADLAAAKDLFAKAEAQMTAEVARGDLGHARELVEFLLAHSPKSAGSNGGESVDRAVELALRDLRSVRHDAEAFEVAAWALHKAGRTIEGEDLMRQSLERNPGSARALRRATTMNEALGRAAVSAELRARAVAIDPTNGGVERE